MSGDECAAADARTGRNDGENSSKLDGRNSSKQNVIRACFNKLPFGLSLREREEKQFAGLLCGKSLRTLETRASLP